MAHVQAIKGFTDLLDDESCLFLMMEQTARYVFYRYGYRELRTPLLEFTELFTRGIGSETDVVQKEMYSLPDSKGRSMSLRPEATAGVMRAYIEHNISGRETVSKYFTYGPMFRHERPQKGRMRQFHQINCECVGPEQPEADAELICMLVEYMDKLGIADLTLQINSLGCAKCRPAYRTLLREWLSSLDESVLCEDCKRRMDTNPLRVLDCKVSTCREHTAAAPVILDHVCPECKNHFDMVTRLLATQKIKYELNHRLVRGLDYYTRTTFELVSDRIGAQGSVAGGGRYDGLIEALGGPQLPGLGFACGMERLAMLMQGQARPNPDFFVAVLDENGSEAGFALTQALRAAGLTGIFSFEKRSLKSAMRQADKAGARFALLLGQSELESGMVTVKNMSSGEQALIAQDIAPAVLSPGMLPEPKTPVIISHGDQ